MKKVLILILCGFLISPLMAESITNQELLKACQDKEVGPQNFCYGFIISAANAAQLYRNITDVSDQFIDICFPAEIKNKELVDLYMNWIAKNPSLASGPAFIGVSSSFSIKYSCPPKKEEKKD